VETCTVSLTDRAAATPNTSTEARATPAPRSRS
jgi:hypothetical protein